MAYFALSIPILIYLQLIISGCYLITFLFILSGFLRNSRVNSDARSPGVKISVIIAARNEENVLPKLLTDLKRQSYSTDLFDIIISDDHSDKRIGSMPELLDMDMENLSILELPDSEKGKKAALRMAAEKSTSELLLFTDADCRVGKDWVKSFANKYIHTNPCVIIGMVTYSDQKGFFKSFVFQEFISLVVTGIGTANLGFPTLCNGANLAVKRNTYLEAANQLHSNTPSGDDVFLLHTVKINNEKVETIKDKNALVSTAAPKTLLDFFGQRARWASKSVLYRDFATIYLSLLVAITNIVFMLGSIQIVRYGFSIQMFLIIVLKIIADYCIIIVGLKYYHHKRSIIWLPIFQLLYSLYLYIALFLGFFKPFNWKGRKY